ncbi:MAG: archaeosortase/exosortase family protein, partial [bacterium]|nr:archaeosortase/exosortase family protein [bacterium]
MIKKEQIIKIVLMGVALAGIYFPAFCWMVSLFMEDDSNYSHGFLIPFVCLWLVWQLRDKLK